MDKFQRLEGRGRSEIGAEPFALVGGIDGNDKYRVLGVGPGGGVMLDALSEGDYETIAAGQSDQALGGAGAAGDYLAGLLLVPGTTSPGAVSIKDGGGSSITVFAGGSSSVSNLVPFFIPLGIRSGAGAWKVTTGSNITAIAVGKFT